MFVSVFRSVYVLQLTMIENVFAEKERKKERKKERGRGRERVRRGDNGCEMAPERSGRCVMSKKRLRD